MDEYKIETLVWELTMGCNLRCRHCGSSCKQKFNDELTTEEALNVVEQIAEVNPKWVCLSGGEPLLRDDWATIAAALTHRNIEVRLITNGTLVTREIAHKMHKIGISIVSVSVDGTEEIHDRVRGTGVFRKVLNAFECLKAENVSIGVNTTVMKDNVSLLEDMSQIFVEYGVCSWQLQPAIPQGRMSEKRDYVLSHAELTEVIDFSYRKNIEGKINVFLAETIGYNTKKEIASRMLALNADKPVIFKGCNAGIRSLGILRNGDVVGCTSVRRPEFVEGNLKDRRLYDLWNDPNSFAWRRNMTVSELGPKCQKCKYVKTCMGGCTNIRLTMSDGIHGDNPMCLYSALCIG